MTEETTTKNHDGNLCVSCQENPIHIAKSGLCKKCYSRARRTSIKSGQHGKVGMVCINPAQLRYASEFLDKGWVYRPATFCTAVGNYSPDFWCPRRKAFVEVATTRQNYHQQKPRYISFRDLYPGIPLLVVTTRDVEIDINKMVNWPENGDGQKDDL